VFGCRRDTTFEEVTLTIVLRLALHDYVGPHSLVEVEDHL